jgi:hypothetical protein
MRSAASFSTEAEDGERDISTADIGSDCVVDSHEARDDRHVLHVAGIVGDHTASERPPRARRSSTLPVLASNASSSRFQKLAGIYIQDSTIDVFQTDAVFTDEWVSQYPVMWELEMPTIDPRERPGLGFQRG